MAFAHRKRLWLAAALTTSSIIVTPVAAQTPPASSQNDNASSGSDDGALGEIVVTAQRRSERLQDVPIAVTALNAQALQSKGMTNALDLSIATPGLTYTQVAGTAAPRIRGIGTVSALGGNENSVATYVDGVYYASSSSSLLSLNNIAQVAVLKGPQGTLFGRNATGGLIQISTLDPRQDFGGNATATYGNRNTIGTTLYVTGGIAPEIAADLAVSYNNQMDGFGRNLTTGIEVNKTRDLTIRSKWVFDIGDATTLKISGDYGRLYNVGPARRPTYGSLITGGTSYSGGPFDVVSNVNPFYHNEQGGGSANLAHHFDGFDLVGITAYRKATTRVVFDIDATRLALASTDNLFKDWQFSQEVQAISTGSGPLNWTLGLFYFDAKGGYDDVTLNLPPSIQTFSSHQKTKSYAGYAQASYKFSPATSLTLGLRYSDETRRFDARGAVFTRATGVTAPTAPLNASISAKKPTWRLALDHRINPGVLVYVSYNRGFKSGGFNGSTFFPAPQSFRPEVLDAYEAGLKADFLDRRLRLNAAAFYYDYRDIQLTSFVSGLVQISNATGAKIRGFDADLTARPIDQLTITAGFSYAHARFGNYPNAQISTPLAAGGNAVGSGSATGNRVPFTPDWTLNLGADYEVKLNNGRVLLSAQYFHGDGWYAEPDNRLRQKPYDLLNGTVTWKIGSDERFSIAAWGKNLTNKVYATTLQTQNTGDVMVPAAGRTFGGTLGVKF